MDRDEITQVLRAHREDMETFGVRSLSLFGSFARGQAGPSSDIDLLVEFDRPVGLFTFVRLQRYLAQLLGRPVDLVTPDALKRQMRERILREAVRAA